MGGCHSNSYYVFYADDSQYILDVDQLIDGEPCDYFVDILRHGGGIYCYAGVDPDRLSEGDVKWLILP